MNTLFRFPLVLFWIVAMAIVPSPSFSQASDPVGKFVAVEGQVLILPSGGGVARQATVGTLVYQGDTLRTGKDSKAKLLMVDDSVLTVAPSTELSLSFYKLDAKEKFREATLKLLEGKVKILVGKLLGFKGRYEVQTPTSVAGVRGTSMVVWTEKDSTTGKTKTYVLVLEGELYVTAMGVTKIVGAGMLVVVEEGQPPEDPRQPTKEERERAQEGTHIDLLPGESVSLPGLSVTGIDTPPAPPDQPPPKPPKPPKQEPSTIEPTYPPTDDRIIKKGR